jgi:hypothetical protein
MSQRTLHYVPPGFKPQLVEIAPDAFPVESKRVAIFHEEVS